MLKQTVDISKVVTNFSENFCKRQICENRNQGKGSNQPNAMRFAISFSAIACCNQWIFLFKWKRFSSGFKIKRVHLNSISLWAHVNRGLNASLLLLPRFQIKLFRSNSACWLLHLICKLDTRANKNKKDKTSLKTTVPTWAFSWKSREIF